MSTNPITERLDAMAASWQTGGNLDTAIAALRGVLALHRTETRWGDDDGEYSLSQEDYDDSPEDYTHLNAFDVCAECFRIEQSPEQHDDENPHAVCEGLAPCPTLRAIASALDLPEEAPRG